MDYQNPLQRLGRTFAVPQLHPYPAIPKRPLCEPAAPASAPLATGNAGKLPAPAPIGVNKTL